MPESEPRQVFGVSRTEIIAGCHAGANLAQVHKTWSIVCKKAIWQRHSRCLERIGRQVVLDVPALGDVESRNESCFATTGDLADWHEDVQMAVIVVDLLDA